jgi:carboxypeptidase family protein
MRKAIALGLIMTVVLLSAPAITFASGAPRQQGGTLTGVAQGSDKQVLKNYTVRVRNTAAGSLVSTGTTSSTGEFSFAGLAPGNYVVEVLDAAGRVVGLSPSIAVAAGTTVSVTIAASAAGAIAAATGGGFGLLGLGTVATAAVITAAGVAAVVAVKATRNDASPSK